MPQEEISQDKALEYRQVAAIVCMDLDLLADIAGDESLSLEDLRKQVQYVHSKKEELINDPDVRARRFGAASMVFGMAAAGMIRSTPLSEVASQ